MRLLIIDNYDSFTFNLKHMCEPYVSSLSVIRNDAIEISDVQNYDKIIISPGPGLPKDAGSSLDIIQEYADKKPILGVCLGAQAIAVAFNLTLFNLKKVMHGKQSDIEIIDMQHKLYRGLKSKIIVGRYHSWAINIENDDKFYVTAIDKEGVVMSFKHKTHDITGVQYHPESILTKNGQIILKNWLKD